MQHIFFEVFPPVKREKKRATNSKNAKQSLEQKKREGEEI